MVTQAQHYEDVLHRGLTEETYLAILHALEESPEHLPRLLDDLHPADVADLLERLPRERRQDVLNAIPTIHLGDVISELDEGVKEHVLQLLHPEEVKLAISELESDDATDLAQSMEDVGDDSGPDAEDFIADHQQKRLLEYA